MSSQYTILIVDDENLMRLTLSHILQKEKYRVEIAANAAEALKCLNTREYDLMFLDLNMPEVSGIDLLVDIHKRYPHMPVLILTAHAALESAIQAVRLGARDYLVKPAEPIEILARVAEILAESKPSGRTQEIVSQMQNLLSQLQKSDGHIANTTSELPTDSARFLKKGEFELDLQERHVTLSGRYIQVTGIYFDYLCTLLRHAPKVVTYKTLVKESQGFDAPVQEARELARWRVHELRHLIEVDPQNPQYILTVRSMGYRLAI